VFNSIRSIPAREIAKWGVCVLALLAPGSFLVLPVLLLTRAWASHARLARIPAGHTDVRIAHRSPRRA
jgi:hypothetical protein